MSEVVVHLDGTVTIEPLEGVPVKPARYRCGNCGELFAAWAPAQRHAETHGGARVDFLTEICAVCTGPIYRHAHAWAHANLADWAVTPHDAIPALPEGERP